jgi:simple sugar transport system substrate-binding protein
VTTAGSKAKVASFDVNLELAQKIADAEILFTVDQKPWLQGYGAIDSLWQTKRGGFSIGGGRPVPTGPSIIEAEGAKSALEFAKEGIR